MVQPVSLMSDGAELLMAEMLEMRRMQIGVKTSQQDTAAFQPAEASSANSVREYQSILATEKPLIPPLFEKTMPPRPLLELAKEGYEAIKAMAEKRAETA